MGATHARIRIYALTRVEPPNWRRSRGEGPVNSNRRPLSLLAALGFVAFAFSSPIVPPVVSSHNWLVGGAPTAPSPISINSPATLTVLPSVGVHYANPFYGVNFGDNLDTKALHSVRLYFNTTPVTC